MKTTELERLRRKCLKAKEELAKLRNHIHGVEYYTDEKNWIWHVDVHDIVSARWYKPTGPYGNSWFAIDTLRRSDIKIFKRCDKNGVLI